MWTETNDSRKLLGCFDPYFYPETNFTEREEQEKKKQFNSIHCIFWVAELSVHNFKQVIFIKYWFIRFDNFVWFNNLLYLYIHIVFRSFYWMLHHIRDNVRVQYTIMSAN